MSGRIFVQTFLCRLTFDLSVRFPWLSHNCTHISLMFLQHTNNFWSGRSCRVFLTLSYTEGGGGGRGHKVPALISRIRIFATNTATTMRFGDFS